MPSLPLGSTLEHTETLLSAENDPSSPILVFDSGMGGLSVVAHLRAALPHRILAYTCDNAALPYGTKADDWLIERIVKVCRQAVTQSRANTLVVACNTASTLALDELRAILDIPVVGTVPAIKPAAAMSRSGVIGLLATSATLKRSYTDNLIDRFAPTARVVKVSGDPLVLQAERWLAGQTPDLAEIQAVVERCFEDNELDTVVLGCTHFPLLRPYLENLAPRHIQWVDSGAAIAQRTAAVTPVVAQSIAVFSSGSGSGVSSPVAIATIGSHSTVTAEPALAMAESSSAIVHESSGALSSSHGHQVISPFPSFATDPQRPGLANALQCYGFASPHPLDVP